jgi:Mg2+ and Co2+ transporter CorA
MTEAERGTNITWLNSHRAHDEEIRYLTEHTDLSPNQARDLIKEHGTDREKLLKIAKTMKAEG